MKKKLVSLLLTFCPIVTLLPVQALAAESDPVTLDISNGSGVIITATGAADDPYLISTADELKAFAEMVKGGNNFQDKTVTLTADIDLSSVCSAASGKSWTPIGDSSNQFAGTFDGDGRKVTNLYVEGIASEPQGLFGRLGSGSRINNLSVSGTVKGVTCVGGVCGENDGGTIENCYFTGSVGGAIALSKYLGGICGWNNDGTIENCYFTGTVSGTGHVGGVCGANHGTITNCYNTGTVSGSEEMVGGVCGYSFGGKITNCYNTGTVTGNTNVGGVCGAAKNEGTTITNCYNTGTVTGGSGVCGQNYDNSVSISNCYGDLASLVSNLTNFSNDVWEISVFLQRPVLIENKETPAGTEEDPYPIPNADALKAFIAIANDSATTVYGKLTADVALTENLTIPTHATLTVSESRTLTVPDGVTLTNNGTITIESGGNITNEGTISNNATLTNGGEIFNNGTITGSGSIGGNDVKRIVDYLDENGETKTVTATEVTSADTIWGTEGTDTWYIVNGEVNISSLVTVTGDVHLILADGCHLTATNGINVADNDNDPATPSPNSLTIYAQSTGDNMGKLSASVPGGDLHSPQPQAAIGGGDGQDAGAITINGGNIQADAYDYDERSTYNHHGAAIGGGDSGGCGTVTINSGVVTTRGGCGAGIGSGNRGKGGIVIINGGSVTAESGGSGIGTGWSSNDFDRIEINGGMITAIGDSGIDASSGTLVISGGTVNAEGRVGPGIGGDNASVSISGGTVEATNTMWNVAIGGATCTVTITYGDITATGGSNAAGIGGDACTVTISDGTITATGGNSGAGIGAGLGQDAQSITITGGTVTATGGEGAAGIGGGAVVYRPADEPHSGIPEETLGGSSGTITISGGTVTATGGSASTPSDYDGSYYTAAPGIGNGGACVYNGEEHTAPTNGSFATGENGSAFITAVSGDDNTPAISDTDDKTGWNGIVVENKEGQVYGDVNLTESIELPTDVTLTIPVGATLTVPENVTLTNNGTIKEFGTLINNGTIDGTGSVREPSAVTVTFQKNGNVVTEVSYGDTVTIVAAIEVVAKSRAAMQDTVDFYLGTADDGTLLGSANVQNGEATLEITLFGENWGKGFEIGGNTITAVFGGSDTLLDNTGTATLTVNKAGQITTSVTINYTAETLSTTTAMEWSADGASWTACTENMSATAFGWDGTAKTVYFRTAGDSGHDPSTAIKVEIPARPAAPNAALELTKSADSITITSDHTGCEFSIDGTTWQDNGAFTGLTAETAYTVYVRLKATNTSFCSEAMSQSVITTAADGSTTLKPGETVETQDGSTVTNHGDTITTDKGGTTTTITPPSSGDTPQVSDDGTVTVPGGSTVQTGNGPVITVGDQGGTVNDEGGITVPGGSTVIVTNENGDTTTIILPSTGGTVTPGENGEVAVPGGSTVTTGGQTVTIPESGGTVVPGGEVKYTVTFNTQDGSPAASQTIPAGGKAAKPSDPIRNGYNFDGWYTEAACTTTWDFDTAVTGNMTLYAKWTKKPTPVTPSPDTPDEPTPTVWENPFTDIKESDWYYAAVEFACENGLFYGTSDTTFSPNGNMTRGMLATVLYRLAKEPGAAADDLFNDVADGKYYTEAVAWAAENGIVAGYGNGKYGPEDPITREQLATILWRYAGSPDSAGNLGKFTDGAKTSDWAVPALQWAVKQKIVSGKGNGILDPRGKATRAEVAVMLMRYCGVKAERD